MNVFELMGKIGLDSSEFKSGLSSAESGMGSLKTSSIAAAQLMVDAIEGVVSKIIEIGTEAINSAASYETSMAKLSTIADTDSVSIGSLSDQIISLSNSTGVAASDLAEVAYNAISAGTSTEDALGMAETASKLATAGFTDTNSALSVLTTSLNAYGDSAGTAEEISDSLIQVQNLGVTTVADLASNMGKAIATGSAFGVSLGNLESAYVSMTKQGINTAEATTYLSSMMNELGDSGSDVSGILKDETGLSFAEMMEEGFSLSDVLGIVYDALGEDSTAMMNLWGSAEAGKASNAIINEGLVTFNDNLNAITNTSGTTEEAYAKMSDTFEHKLSVLQTNAQNFAIEIGEKLLPAIESVMEWVTSNMPAIEAAVQPVIDGISSFIDSVSAWISENWDTIVSVFDTIKTTAGEIWGSLEVIFAAFGEAWQTIMDAIGLGSTNSTDFLNGLAAVIAFVGDAVTVAAEIVSTVVTTIADAVAWLVEQATTEGTFLNTIITGFIDICAGVWDYISAWVELISGAIEWVVDQVDTEGSLFNTIWDGIVEHLQGVWDLIQTCVETAINYVKDYIKLATDLISGDWDAVWEDIQTIFNDIWEGIKSIFTDAWGILSGDIETGITAIQTIWDTVWGAISDTVSGVWETIKTTVSDAVDKILEIMDFEWEWPEIKTPHFIISGGELPWGILGQGTAPTIDVDWYAKAKNQPMILNGAAIFGASGDKLLGGGETGSEMIVGTETMMGMIGNAVSSGIGSNLDEIVSIMNTYMPDIRNRIAIPEDMIADSSEYELARRISRRAAAYA